MDIIGNMMNLKVIYNKGKQSRLEKFLRFIFSRKREAIFIPSGILF